MAPVTRSMSAKSSCECFLPALRARADPTPGVKKAPGKSSVQRKTREKKAATLPPMPSPPPAAPGDSTDNRRGPFIEWYSIKTSDFKDAAALSELVDILREAARQPGCKIVVQEKPAASTTPTFFVIGKLHLHTVLQLSYKSTVLTFLQSGVTPNTGDSSWNPRPRNA